MSFAGQVRQRRRAVEVSQQELAEELGFKHASAVCRMEQDAGLSAEDFAGAIAAIERIVERRGQTDPLTALEVS